tara:strand:+ start:1115 stop:1672 length:558 start_codon:yes stop_codon:yes gene_type:complete
MADPECNESDLDDGRDDGEWRSRYTLGAWIQISIELTYLCVLLIGCIILLWDAAAGELKDGIFQSTVFGVSLPAERVQWIALAMAGMIGGTVFDLKWLYHSVAKASWNRDRLLWRLIVPWNSAMVSLFTGFLLASGIVPFLRNETFDDIYTLLGCGFVFGYFSDNILAAMQNFAQKIFGTLKADD